MEDTLGPDSPGWELHAELLVPSLPVCRMLEVGEQACNLMVSPLGNRSVWQVRKLQWRGACGIQPMDRPWTLILSCLPLSLFEELEILSLLNPLREQGDFSHTYFNDMEVQTGSQRDLAFQFVFFLRQHVPRNGQDHSCYNSKCQQPKESTTAFTI